MSQQYASYLAHRHIHPYPSGAHPENLPTGTHPPDSARRSQYPIVDYVRYQTDIGVLCTTLSQQHAQQYEIWKQYQQLHEKAFNLEQCLADSQNATLSLTTKVQDLQETLQQISEALENSEKRRIVAERELSNLQRGLPAICPSQPMAFLLDVSFSYFSPPL